MPTSALHAQLAEQAAYLVVRDLTIIEASPGVARELGRDATPLLGPIEELGQRLDDGGFDELLAGTAELRVRLGPELDNRPVRLHRLAASGGDVLLEIRSLANEFRLTSLLRRSTIGHMLLTPDVELLWSMTSNDLSEVLPGDDPLNWIDLMDSDDMEQLGRAIHAVGSDPNERRTVRHRLRGDRTYTIVDTVESAVHDPDLGGVLVRSRLEDSALAESVGPEPYRGMTVSDHMPIGVVVASHQGRILHRNAAAAQLVDARAGRSVVPADPGAWVFDRCNAEQAARLLEVFTAATQGASGHCSIGSPIDEGRGLRVSVSPSAGSTVVLTIEDTTELQDAERALRASTRLLEALDDHSEDIVIVLDGEGRSRYVSSSAKRLLGRGTTISRMTELLHFVPEADRRVVLDAMRHVGSTSGASVSIDVRLRLVDGDAARWHQGTMTNLIDDPDVRGLVLTLRDIHERHLADRELRFQATHDALTALPDRAAVLERLETLLSDGERTGYRTAVVFCDVDHFKQINDRAGHRIGDLVLTEVANRLRTAIRTSDFVGRFGGDEFVVVAPDVDDEDHAGSLAQRVFEAVVGAARCDGVEVDISVSMGVAVSEPGDVTAVLLHRADLAMYESKRLGRCRLSTYRAELEDAGEGDRDLSIDLRAALDADELTVHYQPVVSLRDGSPAGFEALARWNHADDGLIHASLFIAVAESAGMMVDVGSALVRSACDGARRHLAAGGEFVAVNLSAAQLAVEGAADDIVEQIHAHDVDPASVVIEVTESAFTQGAIGQGTIRRFRDAGLRVFLDDFGVGHASLNHLRQFPIDGIKIDVSIINPVVDAELVRLIVGVAATLGIETIAEGVETVEQLSTVRELGVDYAQGFLLGRPSPQPDLLRLDLAAPGAGDANFRSSV